jgi:hypothetical protein
MCRKPFRTWEVDVSGYHFWVKRKLETSRLKVGDVFAREVHGHLDGNRHRIICEHERLQRLVSLLVRGGRGERERRDPSRVVLLPRDRWDKICRERG